MRTLEEFNGVHAGRRCFIVAAGPSILNQDLESLKLDIVIAVNSGFLAVPWATYFISDDWSVANWSFFFDDLVHSQTIPLLYEFKLGTSAYMFGNRAVLFRHKKGISIPDKYIHMNQEFLIGETRSSVGTAIMVAHIMGCSKIVLLGVDGCRLGTARYFWQLSKKYKAPYRNDGLSPDRYRKCTVRGQVTDSDLMDINKSWEAFGKAVLKKCKVYNASENSLVDVFPKKSLQEILDVR